MRQLTSFLALIVCAQLAFQNCLAGEAFLEEARVAADTMYVIKCQIYAGQENEKPSLAPKATVFEGQKITIQDLVHRPFVTAVKKVGGEEVPHVEVLKEGLAIEVTVLTDQDDIISVDASLELSQITQVEMKAKLQLPRVRTEKVRMIEVVPLGTKLVVTLGDAKDAQSPRVEFVITRAGE